MDEQNEDEELSVTECANLRGQSRANIIRLIKEGKLSARMIGYNYVIKRKDCEAYKGMSPQEKGKLGAEVRKKKRKGNADGS